MEGSFRVMISNYFPLSPHIQKHSINFFTKIISTLFFHHLNHCLFIEEVINVFNLNKPLKETNLKFLNELLFVWKQFEKLMHRLFVILLLILQNFISQCLIIVFLVLKKYTFQCVVHNVKDSLIIVKAKCDNMMNFIPEKKHLRYITPLLEIFV